VVLCWPQSVSVLQCSLGEEQTGHVMCKEERAGAHAHTPQTQHETLQTVNGRFHQSAAPRNLPNLNGSRLHVCPQTDECRLPRVWLEKTEHHGRCTIALKRSSISPIPNCAESAIKTGLNQSHNKTRRFRQKRNQSPLKRARYRTSHRQSEPLGDMKEIHTHNFILYTFIFYSLSYP